MRDKERIPEIIAELEALWLTMPDQRLGQLIVNLTRERNGKLRDPWVVEDDELLVKIKTWPYFFNN